MPVEAERLEPLRRALDEARVLAHETEGAKREGLEIRVRPEQPARLRLDPLAEQRLDGRKVVTVQGELHTRCVHHGSVSGHRVYLGLLLETTRLFLVAEVRTRERADQ